MRGRTLLLVAALAVLPGCSGLPERTPVSKGRPIGGVVEDAIRVSVQGPVPGAGPRDIVAGFLRASLAFEDDPTVAREFLAPTAVGEWFPREVLITENDVVPRIAVSGTTATVSVPVTGALDAEGHYRDLPPGTTQRLRLPMVRRDGQWRIAGGLDHFGALMTRTDFARYGSYDIRYVAPLGQSAVEDRRWILRGPGLLTRLARAVVAPAPPYLQGAVVTGAPEYTEIVGAVSLDNGTVAVQLSDRVSGTDDDARRALWARFASTLSQVPGVERVDLLVGETRLAAGGVPDRPLTADDVPLQDDRLRTDVAVTRVGSTLSAVAPGAVPDDARGPAPADITRLPRLADGWYHLALAADGSEIAAASGDDAELSRWRSGTRLPVPRFATDLTRPAYDRLGTLWVGGETPQGARLFALDTTTGRAAAPTAIDVPWLHGRDIRSVEIAEDGRRLVVVSEDSRGGRPRIDVAGIVRQGSRPVALAARREIGSVLTDATEVCWVDPSTVAVIGRRATDVRRRVVLVPLNDAVRVLGEVPSARLVTAVGGARSLVVVTDDHRVLLRSGNTFTTAFSSREFALPGR